MPALIGWKKVSEGIDYHAKRFIEGKQILEIRRPQCELVFL